MEERIGLVDIGSNTIRLVIFNFNKESGINELLNIKTPARLSQYLTKDNKMSKEGIKVLIDALHSFKSVSDKFNVTELHPIATVIRQSKTMMKLSMKLKMKLVLILKSYPKKTKLTMVTTQLLTLLKLKTGIRRHRWRFN